MFLGLMAHPNTGHIATTPITPDLNQRLVQVEGDLLHKGGDPLPLLDEVQAEFARNLEEALVYHNTP